MADLINIKFPDGKSTKIEKGLSGFDIAKQISISLSKKATEHKFNGYTCTECFSVSSFFNNIAPLVNHHKFARLMMYV